jgi:hypothetical protein
VGAEGPFLGCASDSYGAAGSAGAELLVLGPALQVIYMAVLQAREPRCCSLALQELYTTFLPAREPGWCWSSILQESYRALLRAQEPSWCRVDAQVPLVADDKAVAGLSDVKSVEDKCRRRQSSRRPDCTERVSLKLLHLTR